MVRRALLVCAALGAVACKGDGAPSAQAKAVEPDDPAADAVDAADRAEPARPPAPLEHTLWQLAPNRLMAHRAVDGDLVVDAGSPGFARYTRFGVPKPRWSLGVEVDGQPTAALRRGGGSLELPLTAAQASAAQALVLRVHAAEDGTLVVKLDGRAVEGGRIAVVPGWQTVTVPAAGRWREGENQVVIESNLGDDLRLRWLRVASRPVAADAEPLAGVTHDGGALRFADRAGLAWYVEVPAAATLVGDVEGDCKLDVVARDGDGTTVGGILSGAGARVDLAPLAGKVARLELSARDCAAGGALRDGRITGAGAPPPATPDGPPPRYVLFWVMDALRADKIGAFSPGARAETPAFDRLARTGAVFRSHYVGGNESQVSHSSMWTGLYPAVHTVRTAGEDVNFRIPRRLTTMGQRMAAAGYYTIGVTGNGFVDAYNGYARGFQEFRNLMEEKGTRNGVIHGTKMVDDVVARLRERKDEHDKIFVFIGTIDTHNPLQAYQPWIDRYDPGYRGPMDDGIDFPTMGIVRGRMGCSRVPPRREIQRLHALYDSAVSYSDAVLGEMLAKLEELGIADQTMIVITADHGEELFEDKRCGHGASLRETLARVPMLVHYPPRVAARVVEVGTEGIDVLPTLLDAVGAEPPVDVQGESLRGLAAGAGAAWPRPAFASQYEYAFAARLGRWKIRVSRQGPIVTDLVADPLERSNLANQRPLERRFLTDHLGLYLSQRTRWRKGEWGVVSNMTEAAIEAMEAAR